MIGDWDGNVSETPGVRRGNSYYLRNSNSSGPGQVNFGYGMATDVPVTGDWDGNGTDTPGVRRGTIYLLRNSNSSGVAQWCTRTAGRPAHRWWATGTAGSGLSRFGFV